MSPKNSQTGEMLREGYTEGHSAFCALPLQVCHPPSTSCVYQLGSPSNPVLQGFLQRLHFVGTIDEIIGYW